MIVRLMTILIASLILSGCNYGGFVEYRGEYWVRFRTNEINKLIPGSYVVAEAEEEITFRRSGEYYMSHDWGEPEWGHYVVRNDRVYLKKHEKDHQFPIVTYSLIKQIFGHQILLTDFESNDDYELQARAVGMVTEEQSQNVSNPLYNYD